MKKEYHGCCTLESMACGCHVNILKKEVVTVALSALNRFSYTGLFIGRYEDALNLRCGNAMKMSLILVKDVLRG
jgi:hypothetical protein